jgi:hypothetical protein
MSLSCYRNALITLFNKLHELQKDPTNRVPSALEIQDDLYERFVGAERHIHGVREASRAISLRGSPTVENARNI